MHIPVPWRLTQAVKRLEKSDAMPSRYVHRWMRMNAHHLIQWGIDKDTLNIQLVHLCIDYIAAIARKSVE
jgi:hypothetical protein